MRKELSKGRIQKYLHVPLYIFIYYSYIFIYYGYIFVKVLVRTKKINFSNEHVRTRLFDILNFCNQNRKHAN